MLTQERRSGRSNRQPQPQALSHAPLLLAPDFYFFKTLRPSLSSLSFSPFFIPPYESSPRPLLPNQNYSGCHCLPDSLGPVCSPLPQQIDQCCAGPPTDCLIWGNNKKKKIPLLFFHAVWWQVVISCPLKTWRPYNGGEAITVEDLHLALNFHSFHAVSRFHFSPLSHLFRRISYSRSLTQCCIVRPLHPATPPPLPSILSL